MQLITKIFGTQNSRELKAMEPRIAAINALEPQIASLSDVELIFRLQNIKQSVTAACQDHRKAAVNSLLDPILHEVFAIVREAGRRVLNMRHYDVQLIGGMTLHSGRIAEMKTGEGKTLMATLPAVLNAMTGRGVHIVTVNDYLASRDADWMGRIYRFLGLSVGVVIPHQSEEEKCQAYLADITYGQNNEFGFDYLRDNMKFELSDYRQRGHQFAIVDEVDSILIDEARTPLIISGPAQENAEKYKHTNSIIPRLRKDADYSIDEKSRSVMLTEIGNEKAEKLLGLENLYDPANIETLHHLNQALRAHSLFKRDIDYVIERGEVVIVDEHTGRLMHGRRWSDGLHQAIEAKENVRVQAENQTLATITFQNYFRMYQKLSGMTGTADTEAEEFAKIYDLDVLVIPTNKAMSRLDEQDQVYKTEREKFDVIAADIEVAHKKEQPVLVGTVSVEKSEILSKKLNKLNIPHHVLNAKKHRDEAAIISQAGRLGSVTIATNMAGRGTDIILGGDPEFMARDAVAKQLSETDEQIAEFAFLSGRPDLIIPDPNRQEFQEKAIQLYAHELEKAEQICKKEKQNVLAAGGLRIIGTERHESRRIDNQLRGRSGRQGDPGSSRFYLSLQDDLMRIFGSDRMISVMERLGMQDGEPIEHPWVSKSIENAQKRVEGFHFDSRKQIIEYDDVMNQQRNAIYSLRRQVLGGENIRKLVFDLVEEAIINQVQIATPEKTSPHEWKLEELCADVNALTGVRIDVQDLPLDRNELMDFIYTQLSKFYTQKEKSIDSEMMRRVERLTYLQIIDQFWKDHLQAMDHLREGIHFQGYAQKDPKQEYKKEGFVLFNTMRSHLRYAVLERIFKSEIRISSHQQLMEDMARLEAMQKAAQDELERRQSLPDQPESDPKPNRQQRRRQKA
ncbi:MAG: preprotein translocase subunit SecA [Myxococcaceae bacterium]|nr:preprotein translocase subunit SecA [Myxococcaceae bacterium]MBH2005811.1 preprotein translocase subunit SecA [Myxococcaceae bacterium]